MAGQTEFLQAIQELERLGETNGNQLSCLLYTSPSPRD